VSTHDQFEDVFGTRRGTGGRLYHRDIAAARGRVAEITDALDEGQAVAVALNRAFARLERGHVANPNAPSITMMPSEEPQGYFYTRSVAELLKKGNRETWFAVLACAANIHALEVTLPLERTYHFAPMNPADVADQVAYLMTEDWPQIEALLKGKG